MRGNSSVFIGDFAWLPQEPGFGTIAIHAGYDPADYNFSPVVPAISLSTTFEQDTPNKTRGFSYTRNGNPTRKLLETAVAALEKAKHGHVFASGMAAVTSIIFMLSTGDHIICMDDVYGGTGRLFRQMKNSSNILTTFVDLTDPEKLKSSLRPTTKLVYMESPTNPTLKVVDIALIAEIAHQYSKDILVAVDNTMLSPFFQRPLSFGADMVLYSLTKYINGHSDVLMGAVVTSRDDLSQKLSLIQASTGAVPSPFDCYLVLRGLRTLHVRMPLHMRNAITVANFLSAHPKVEKVNHPGIPSHPQHELALRQSSGHSGLISFYMKAGIGSPTKFLQNLRFFSMGQSMGGYESLASLPIFMSHASVSVELREQLGLTGNLIRLSIGLESADDLVGDLDQALNNCSLQVTDSVIIKIVN